MNIFSAIIRKCGPLAGALSAYDLHRLMGGATKLVFPVLKYQDEVQVQEWTSVEGNVVAQIASNESSSTTFFNKGVDFATFSLGYSDKNESYLFDRRVVRPERASNCAGCFAFGCLEDSGVDLITDAAGTHPFYIGESDAFYVVSSKSRLTVEILNRIRETQNKEPLGFDLVACRDLALQGHYLEDGTAFREVRASKVHEHIRVSRWGVKRESWFKKQVVIRPVMAKDYDALLEDLAASLADSVSWLSGTDLHLSITGGRDSRLLAAILHNCSSINVRTATSGFSDNPDVYLGALISERLGWRHEVKVPKTKDSRILVESPLQRALRTLDVHDCSTSAWDECPDYGAYSPKPTMSGVGGEILRGGMTLIAKDCISSSDAKRIIENTISGGGFFNKDIQASAREKARELLMLCEENPHAALDRYYHQHRNHRWVCNRRNGARLRWRIVDPLLDNRVLCLALSVDAETRWSERLVFDLIDKLAPGLIDIPIEGERWRFERTRACESASSRVVDSWGSRHAIRATGNSTNRDWRKLEDPDFRGLFKRILWENLSEESLKLFDEQRLDEYVQTSQYATTLWHIFTTVVLLNSANLQSRVGKSESIEVRI